MSKHLVLFSQIPDDVSFAEAVAKSCGLTFFHAQDLGDVVEKIEADQAALLMADMSSEAQYRAFETAIQESIGLFSDRLNANAIHFLSNDMLEKVRYLVESPLFGHFILRNYHDPKAAGEHYGRIARSTFAHRAFGLAQLLPENAKIQKISLNNTRLKQEAVEAVKSYLVAAKFQTRMATIIANAVDELVMNAMFDAPVDQLGKQTLAQTPRSAQIDLAGRNLVEMEIGFDGEYAAITAIDHFGSLDKNKLLSHVSKIYTNEEYKVKTQVAGAGIGLATVFRSGGSFFFVSENQVRTEVTVFFKRTDSFREFKDQFRFLSTQFYF